MLKFPHFKQLDSMDCGPTCLRIISKYYGKNYTLQTLRDKAQIGKDGVNMLGISETAELIGFSTIGAKMEYSELMNGTPKPCVLHWNKNHFVVLPPQKKHWLQTKRSITIADPGVNALINVDEANFKKKWLSCKEDNKDFGVVLLIEPTPKFYEESDEVETGTNFKRISKYFLRYKFIITQVFLAVLVTSLFQLILPFLTQNVVDIGINSNDLGFIYLMLIGQIAIYFGRFFVDFIRSRLLLYISTRVNIAVLSDFWIKMMGLPISYFDQKQTGDIMQRIQDQSRIQQFMSKVAVGSIFGIVTLLVYSIVLLYYDYSIFLLFLAGSLLYIFWITLFLKYRRNLDYQKFSVASRENTITMQLVQGMQDIKLNNCEIQKRWEWENLQTRLFHLTFKGMNVGQIQQLGALFINQTKDVLITLIVAKGVLQGQFTLGTMLAIQYIIGQLSGPVEQLIELIQSGQEAKISLERLNEVMELKDEEQAKDQLIKVIPKNQTIIFRDVQFTYTGAGNEPALSNINLVIPCNKTTAIVGTSGSGKTTLIKLLLKFYTPEKGEILIGETTGKTTKLKNISHKYWRKNVGVVMQDGFIFNDTIAKNIAVGDEMPDMEKLTIACKTANILDFIESLPLGFNTKIGTEGNGISTGQKQRIIIARAIYRDPDFLFFDEATNALDANNEKVIVENLRAFFKNKTVIVVAHRLSTVRNADNIIVLENAKLAEQGSHDELVALKSKYYNLVKNQLELGN